MWEFSRWVADFQKCYAGADSPAECTPQKEDYLECLHHTKEVGTIILWKTGLAEPLVLDVLF